MRREMNEKERFHESVTTVYGEDVMLGYLRKRETEIKDGDIVHVLRLRCGDLNMQTVSGKKPRRDGNSRRGFHIGTELVWSAAGVLV